MKISDRIVEVCGILEKYGPCSSANVACHMHLSNTGKAVEHTNAGKYCLLAMELGLAVVDKSPGGNGRDCNIYTVSPGWRHKIKPQDAELDRVPMREMTIYSYASSIFSVGVALPN